MPQLKKVHFAHKGYISRGWGKYALCKRVKVGKYTKDRGKVTCIACCKLLKIEPPVVEDV